MKCVNCNTILPANARFCFNCGHRQPIPEVEVEEKQSSRLDFNKDIGKQLNVLFFETFRSLIKEDFGPEELPVYTERMYDSAFRDLLDRRIRQTAEEIKELRESDATINIDDRIAIIFEEILDYFFIHYCRDLNRVALPEAILKYQGLDATDFSLYQMVQDYLAFEQEPETVYTDFLKMPIEKLKNASKAFLFPDKEEKILFICNQSILGSCKEGFAMTDAGIYWKAHLDKPKAVLYTQIQSLAREKEWITINGHFFNANPSLNLKLLKLLRKIKQLYT